MSNASLEFEVLSIIPRLPDGRSIADTDEPITMENVERFHAPSELLVEMAAYLRGAGLTIIGQSLLGLTVQVERSRVSEILQRDESGAGYVVPEVWKTKIAAIRKTALPEFEMQENR